MVTLKLKNTRPPEPTQQKSHKEAKSPTKTELPDNMAETRRSSRRASTKPSLKYASPFIDGRKQRRSVPVPAAPDSPEDTIRVQPRGAAAAKISENDDDSPLSELNDVENDDANHAAEKEVALPAAQATKNGEPMPNRPWGRSGKAPVRDTAEASDDVEMLDADDDVAVEEYDFSNEVDHEDESDDGQDTEVYKKGYQKGTATENVITISSDDDREDSEPGLNLNHRPWKNFDRQQRYNWEMMYCTVTSHAIQGEWEKTEDYQREKDNEMLRYIEDFPTNQWVIPQHVAKDGYYRLEERRRWRNLGIRIYDAQQRVPGWTPGSTFHPNPKLHSQFPQLQTPINIPSNKFPRPTHQVSQSSLQPLPPGWRPMPNGIAPPGMHPGVPQPHPHQVLPSQSNRSFAPPNGTAFHPSMGPPSLPGGMPGSMTGSMLGTMPHRMHYPGGVPSQVSPGPALPPSKKGRSKEKKTIGTPPSEPPPPPPPTPPYETRPKPAERKPANNKQRRTMKRQAEAGEFPWNRDLNFREARANAAWDDSIYDIATLESMAAARAHNESVLERIDSEEAERQRQSRLARKARPDADGASDAEKRKTGPKKKASAKGEGGGSTNSDPYHSGHYSFATPEDQKRAIELGKSTADEIILAIEMATISLDACADITILWNPGKKGYTQDLQQAHFTIRDHVLTRQQIERTPILTRRAAECVVDFCPDMLWRSILLRIASEAGYGNKDMRDRMCLNGNYCDKATITKRIGAALGQKQQQSIAKNRRKAAPGPTETGEPVEIADAEERVRGYAKGEDEYYNVNVVDFANYVEYFGHRSSHRSQLKIQRAGTKRKAREMDAEDEGGVEDKVKDDKKLGGKKPDITKASDATDTGGETGGETSAAEAASDAGSDDESQAGDEDAVSVQSDTLLDQMDED